VIQSTGPTIALPLSLGLLLVACSGSEPPQPQPSAPEAVKPSLILVTLDTTRADHIGAYGYKGAVTPTIDGLAAEGLRLDRAYATVPLTTPSHASMMTGLYPTRHGIHTNGDAILPEGVRTLAEELNEAGYRTGASVAAFVTTELWNLDQGFTTYYDEVGRGGDRWSRERPANEVVDDALRFVEAGEEPFFLWVHVFDAHAPYAPPEPFASQMPKRPYDGEIAFVDSQLARLKAAVPEDTAWIVVADHGEALSHEHGEATHGLFLYDATQRVPFIVRPPGGIEGTSSSIAVSGVDVMPTALGMLGQDVPADLDGVDLSPLLRGEDLDRAPVYMESNTVLSRFGYHPEWAVAKGDLKWMATPNPHLYALGSDPAEATNLLAVEGQDHSASIGELQTFLDGVRAQAVTAEAAQLSPDLVAQLEALGYVSGTAETAEELPDIDAKDRLDTIGKLERVHGLARGTDEQKRQAEAIFKEVLAAEPQMAEARVGLGRLLMDQGRLDEAEQVYREALAASATSTVCRSNLAMVLAQKKRFDEAVAELAIVLEQVPGDEGARMNTLKMLSESGQEDEALARARQYLAEDPTHPAWQAMAGVLLMSKNRSAEAEPLLRGSLEGEAPRQYVHRMLARIEVNRGHGELAAEHLEKELETYPRNAEARQALGQVYMNLERYEDAAAEFGFLLERDSANREARRGAAQAAFNVGDYTRAQELLAPALDQPDSNILMLQANILSKLGDQAQAQATAEKAKALRKAEQSGRRGG
jgi:choline-sulfatase